MIPWKLLESAQIPGGGELRLMQRGDEFSIRLASTQLMTSRSTGSEEALATLTCDRLRDGKRHVLIGGLGMGFTLRAALAVLNPRASIIVAELVPAVVAWARGPLSHMFNGALDDPRVTVHAGDVGRLIGTGRSLYDAIILDVDNGPEGLTHKANDRLYDLQGLGSARAALKPDGVLAVWSSTRNKRFSERLHTAGFRADQIRIGAGGAQSFIWFATPVPPAPQRGARDRAPDRAPMRRETGSRA